MGVILVYDPPELTVFDSPEEAIVSLELEDLRRPLELFDAAGRRLEVRTSRATPAFCAPSKTIEMRLVPGGDGSERLRALLQAKLGTSETELGALIAWVLSSG